MRRGYYRDPRIGGGSYRAHLVLAAATARAGKAVETLVAETGHDPSRTFIHNLGHAVSYGLVDDLDNRIEAGRIVYG
ncbi:hypothetical protein [Novosphingobium meiothermophilum]|uniref:hypothetical protein n=1 Tax=Novosphingobium meiothermophilum TaxID=2202251 RepID=UPI000D6E0912|nr:hypothetical protein [Novosphingobium meiothermophilum]